MNNGRYIYRIFLYIFLFVQVLYSEYHCAAAAECVRLIGLFRKGHTVRQSCVGTRRHSFRARGKVTMQLYEILGPGNLVILRDSGHRVYPGRAQNNSIELYLLSGKDMTHRDYHYRILQSRNMNFKYLYFNFGAVLTQVTTRTPSFLRDYT